MKVHERIRHINELGHLSKAVGAPVCLSAAEIVVRVEALRRDLDDTTKLAECYVADKASAERKLREAKELLRRAVRHLAPRRTAPLQNDAGDLVMAEMRALLDE